MTPLEQNRCLVGLLVLADYLPESARFDVLDTAHDLAARWGIDLAPISGAVFELLAEAPRH